MALEGFVYQFGGKDKLARTLDTVYKMDETFNWSILGQRLQTGRFGHRSVRSYLRSTDNKQIIHVGGGGEQNVECWELLNDGNFEIQISNFKVEGWRTYPETFIIGTDEFNH